MIEQVSVDTPILTTERLMLRPITLDDAEFIQREFPHWEMLQYLNLGVPWPYPPDGAISFVRSILQEREAGLGRHVWSIRLLANPEAIGLIDIHIAPELGGDHRGFWIARAFQGHGYASEAADAVTEFWFNILGQPELRVTKAVANQASRRISERQGMQVVWRGQKSYIGGLMPAETWLITQAEWLTTRTSLATPDFP